MKVLSMLVLSLAVAGAVSGRELTQTWSSGGTCSASADTHALTASYDGFASAFANAFIDGCSDDYTGDKLVKRYCEIYDTCALALAEVCVSAAAKCKTYGNAFGCASAFATADKSATAIIALYAEACAYAKNVCTDCDPTATAAIFSSLVVELYARAKATVSVSVCSFGNMSASAKAMAKCLAKTLAHGVAQAHAKAMIQGGCTSTGSQLAADAIAQVDTTITADPKCFCTGYATSCVNRHCTVTWSRPADSIAGSANLCPLTAAYYRAECQAFAGLVN